MPHTVRSDHRILATQSIMSIKFGGFYLKENQNKPFLKSPIFPDCHTKPSKLCFHSKIHISETERRSQLINKPMALTLCILLRKYLHFSKQLFMLCVHEAWEK